MIRSKTLSRRTVLRGLAATGVAASAPAWAQGAKHAALTVHPKEVLASVPADYRGLSYESAQLVHPGYFSADNKDLVALVRTLGPRGVLRIGGNTSAFTVWRPDQEADASDAAPYGPDLGARVEKQKPDAYPISGKAIDNLRGFLDATGWGLIYGLNLRYGTPEAAAEEAAYVQKTCGAKLLALQFGNEPDLFNHVLGSEDESTRWTYEEFLPAWKAMYAAVHAKLPQVPIAGPDCAFNAAWVERFAADTRGMVQALTTHYYAEGPPKDPRMTIDLLLHPGQKIADDVYPAIDAAKKVGLPFRMSEGNSCFNGGKPGVSDTLASALWAGDFMLDLAARGTSGVNLHGGGLGVYTPIATARDGGSTARPDFYGMWLAGQFAGARLVRAELAGMPAGANVTAYASEKLLAVFNKDAEPVELRVRGVKGKGAMFVLTGPALDGKTGVTFGTGAREPGMQWALGANGPAALEQLIVPGASAVLVRMG